MSVVHRFVLDLLTPLLRFVLVLRIVVHSHHLSLHTLPVPLPPMRIRWVTRVAAPTHLAFEDFLLKFADVIHRFGQMDLASHKSSNSDANGKSGVNMLRLPSFKSSFSVAYSPFV